MGIQIPINKCAVRTQRWRFVDNKTLYDIPNDPGEIKDVASSHPEVVESGKITRPVYVRYLFAKPEPDAEFSLTNAEGISASSFITDNLKPPREPLEEISAEQLAADRKQAEEKKQKRRKKDRETRKKKASK